MGYGAAQSSSFPLILFFITGGIAIAAASLSFEDNFDLTCAAEHFKTSPDGQIVSLYLYKNSGCGFQTKKRHLFGWFSMKMKLAGGDSAGVVTAFYMCSDKDAAKDRDEVDIEFLGNRSGQPYLIQTNIYKGGVGNREQRHSLWFDPTADFHTYSFLWNPHNLVFFVDRVPIRVHRNGPGGEGFFPSKKPMYLFSSIWNADDWATRGGLEKTNWTLAPFVSSYKDFTLDVSSAKDAWWNQPVAWSLSSGQALDSAWVHRNLLVYDYCADVERFPTLPPECSLRS
ncbi:xyloglucan endotransglucosylase/hydrolase 8 [Wolffia australiana]